MKALTIWQPWASLILVGAKPYEFRSWQPPSWLVGDRLGIHAGARPVKLAEVQDLIRRLERPGESLNPCLVPAPALDLLRRVERGLVEAKHPSMRRTAFRLPLSSILATAEVGPAKRCDECAREMGLAAGGNDSDRDGTFNWGWPLTDVRPVLPPVECSGAQGLWDWHGDMT